MCCVNEPLYQTNANVFGATDHPKIDSAALERSLKRPRRVRFNIAQVVAEIEPSSSMSVEDRDRVWYQQDDLNQFRNDCKDLYRKIRSSELIVDQPVLNLQADAALASENETARGLEHKVSIERQRNKFLAMRAIVKAQERYNSAEQLAVVASKCTAWSKEVALCTGYQDFYMVYNPELVHLVPTTTTVKFPLLGRKRTGAGGLDDNCLPPTKKQRTLSPVPIKRTKTMPLPVVLLS